MWRTGLLSVLGASALESRSEKCHALALSGGGDHFSFVAGGIIGLLQELEVHERQWQVVTGISTGSLLASVVASYDIGQEYKLEEALYSLIWEYKNSPGIPGVSTNWPAGVNPANQTGMLKTSMRRDTILKILERREVGDRMFSIGATNDVSGELTLWDENSMRSWFGTTDHEKWAKYLEASMSAPGLDESVKIDHTVYSSATPILGTDIFSAVLKCQEKGYETKDIVLDVITSDSHANLAAWNQTTDDVTLQVAARGEQITAFAQQMQNIFDACDAFPGVQWRHFVTPSTSLPSNGTVYDAKVMLEMASSGIADAVNRTKSPGQHCSIADSYRHSNTVPKKVDPEEKTGDVNKCYVMSLSGGGAKGAFEAGVVSGLINKTSPAERQWQYFTGISAGSILTGGSHLFSIGQEAELGDFLMASILDFTNGPDGDHVYSDWPSPAMELTESGFENSTALLGTLERTLATRPAGNRKFVISSCVDMTGELHTWDEKDIQNADGSPNMTKLARFIRASAAIPGIFQTVEIDGTVYSDGSTVMGSNVFSAINRCIAAGYSEENIVMDVVTTASNRLATWDESTNNNAQGIKNRASGIQQFTSAMADILDACYAYPTLGWRYYVQAPEDLPGSSASFNTKALTAMVNVGLQSAANATISGHCAQADTYRSSNVVKNARRSKALI
jgi:predicted acylesterase/phospholipase RssA